MVASSGIHFGSFEVLSRIGVGGMGEVFQARTQGRRAVALKLIRPEYACDPIFRRMFAAEARVGAMLNHPNLVQLIDSGEVDGVSYLAMELVEGVSLEQLLGTTGALSLEMAAHIALAILAALEYAHERRGADGRSLALVHRDVSAVNVLVSLAGEVKLADFGVVKLDGQSLTSTNELKGKRSYLAPEQLTVGARGVDRRCDLFAVGVVMCRLLAGRAPFADVADWIAAGAAMPAIDGPLAPAVRAALAVDPAERFGCATEFAAEVRRVVEPRPEMRAELARLVGKVYRGWRPLGEVDRLILAQVGAPGDGTARVSAPQTRAAAPPLRRPARVTTGLVVLTALVAIAGSVGWWRASRSTHAEARMSATAPAPANPAPSRAEPATIPVSVKSAPVVSATPEIISERPPKRVKKPARARPTAAPSVAPAAATAATEEPSGQLTLITNPWGIVYLDGRRIGVTPFAHVRLPAGHHVLSIDVEGSGRRTQLAVDVPRGSELRMSAQLP
jgi:serine/threonine-protein kinase